MLDNFITRAIYHFNQPHTQFESVYQRCGFLDKLNQLLNCSKLNSVTLIIRLSIKLNMYNSFSIFGQSFSNSGNNVLVDRSYVC